MSTKWTSLFIPPDSPFKMGSITFDAITEETHAFESSITEFPVESGATVSDNITLKPVVLTIKALSTDYPFSFLGIGEGIPILSTSKSTELFNILVDLRDARTTIDVITGIRSYKNMAIQSLSTPRNQPLSALYFEITLKQILTASAQLIKIPKSQVLDTVKNAASQVPSPVSKGLQQPKKLAPGSIAVHGFEKANWIEKRYAI